MPWNNGIKSYNRKFAFILDAAPKPKTPPAKNAFVHKHAYNTRHMEEMFKDYSDFEIVPFCMEKGWKKKQFYADIEAALADKTEDDLLWVYYEGTAGGTDKEYTL